MTEQLDLDALEALYSCTTPGTWSWEDDPATVYAGRSGHEHGDNLFGRLDLDINGDANLDCIIALHNSFPALLAELREARAIRARLDVEAGKKFKHDGGTVGWWDQG